MMLYINLLVVFREELVMQKCAKWAPEMLMDASFVDPDNYMDVSTQW